MEKDRLKCNAMMKLYAVHLIELKWIVDLLEKKLLQQDNSGRNQLNTLDE